MTKSHTYSILNISNEREVDNYVKCGWKVTGFETKPIFSSQIVSLEECMKTIKKQKAMDFILDTFRFSKGREDGDWDTIMKISIMETNPEEEKQFGEDWIKNYLRFNH